MDAVALLLTTASRNTIHEANIEAAYAQFVSRAPHHMSFATFCEAVATCGRDGLIHDPVRLPEGVLQCHWHLELTAKGVDAATKLLRLPRSAGQHAHDPAAHR
jgi:hypothetical protein